jgi:hypothetical protein
MFQKDILISLSIIFIVVFSLPCFSQDKKYHNYKVIGLETNVSSKGVNEIETNYQFKGFQVKTIEQYYRNSDDQQKGLVETLSKWKGCMKISNLVDKTGKVAGKRYICSTKVSGENKFIIGYTYFDSLNKAIYIIGNSAREVAMFSKGICPLARHLYNDRGCPEF